MRKLRRSFAGLEMRKNWPGYVLVAPALIAILALSIYPLLRGISLSFINYNLVRPNSKIFNTFAGLRNYRKIFQDSIFLLALSNTGIWTVANLFFQLIIAMLLALALNKNIRGRALFRTISLVPWAIPASIASMTFMFLFSPNIGIINMMAVKLGLFEKPISWVGNIDTAFPAVAYVAIWRGIPFQMIFILAALQAIPHELYESAQVDGASSWQQFWKITLPIIKEPLAIATILNTIGIVSCFNTIWLLTGGGPLYSTEILYTYAYRQGFIVHDLGTAAAASVILFAIITLFAVIYLRMVQEEQQEVRA